MTKKDIANRVHDALAPRYSRKEIEEITDRVLSELSLQISSGNSIELRGLGSFRVTRRRAVSLTNPRTGVPFRVPERSAVYFKPSKLIRQALR